MNGLTKDSFLRLAREAGLPVSDKFDGIGYVWCSDEYPIDEQLQRFANLVAAAEREACAKVCDEKVDAEYATGKVDHNEMGWTQACAIAIRARGRDAA
jgi:hypothetical protein